MLTLISHGRSDNDYQIKELSTDGGRSPSEGTGEMVFLYVIHMWIIEQLPGYIQQLVYGSVETDGASSDYADACILPHLAWSPAGSRNH